MSCTCTLLLYINCNRFELNTLCTFTSSFHQLLVLSSVDHYVFIPLFFNLFTICIQQIIDTVSGYVAFSFPVLILRHNFFFIHNNIAEKLMNKKLFLCRSSRNWLNISINFSKKKTHKFLKLKRKIK